MLGRGMEEGTAWFAAEICQEPATNNSQRTIYTPYSTSAAIATNRRGNECAINVCKLAGVLQRGHSQNRSMPDYFLNGSMPYYFLKDSIRP
jgi:hypothetical protein